jgi:hypothetical protein
MCSGLQGEIIVHEQLMSGTRPPNVALGSWHSIFWEWRDDILAQKPAMLTDMLRAFPQSLQTGVCVVLKPIPSKPFQFIIL